MRFTVVAASVALLVVGLTGHFVPLDGLSFAAPPPVEKKDEKKDAGLALNDLPDGDGVVLGKLRRFAAAAEKLAKPGWTKIPWRNETYRGGPAHYVARWCEQADRKGQCNCSRDPIPNHYVEIHGNSMKQAGNQVDGVELFAGYLPKTGWGARLEYRTYNGQALIGEGFDMFFYHDKFNQSQLQGQDKWAIQLGNSYFATTKAQGEFSYNFGVSMYGDPKTWMGDTRTPRDRDVERYLASPEAFRDAALAELAQLEAHARKQIPSGAALRTVISYKDVRSENPPKEVPLDAANQPPKDQVAIVLKEALADIEARRTLVREHYPDMFSAAKTAFPLLECLGKK